jgi:hypothetical protein
MKVFIYFNLHRRLFSVKAMEGEFKGRVVAHVDRALLSNATFKVSQAGRQRVLREKKKNVHAGVVGNWETVQHYTGRGLTAITYNPYKYSSFVTRDEEKPVTSSPLVALSITDKTTINALQPV